MNPDWIAFLQSNGAQLSDDGAIKFISAENNGATIHPITHLVAFSVSGADAASFLQGQLTCNINDIDDNQASFAAYCTAKGRVISTLLVCKQNDNFLVILPASLVEKVIKKLRMFILRSKVTIENKSEQYCLLGLQAGHTSLGDAQLPDQVMSVTQEGQAFIKLPSSKSRFLSIANIDQAKQLWTNAINAFSFSAGNSDDWIFQDLSAGIPWFSDEQSEEFIPQMLNIDKLDGISFNKGCYTGQEIVARTHYLGKAKRELFLAECPRTSAIEPKSAIISRANQETCGKILAYCCNEQICRLLLVMPSERGEEKDLVINNSEQAPITIIPFQ